MLVSGSLPYITDPFIESVLNTFKLIILHNPHHYPKNETIFQVYNTAVDTINDLKDPIEYSVFFLSGHEDKQLLEKLIPKLERDKPQTVVIIPVTKVNQFSDVLLALKHISSVSFAIVGEIFGKNIPSESSRSSHIIHTALTQKRAEFTGNDLVSIYPISEDDVLKGVQHILFSNIVRKRVFFLFYEHPQTIISTIHLLKKAEPDLQILYDQQAPYFPELPKHTELEKQILSKFHLSVSYIDEILDGFEKSVKQTIYSSVRKELKRKRKPSLTKKLVHKKPLTKSLFTIMTISLLLFIIINVLLTLSGVLLAKQSLQSLQNGNFSKAHTQLSYANKCFTISQPVISLGFTIARQFHLPAIESSYATFTSGMQLSRLASSELAKINKIQSGLKEEELLETLATASYLYFAAQSSPTFARIPYVNELANNASGNILATSSVLPEILGYTKEKRYLLLFQNSGEIRPTGGFIGSVGELTIEKGKTTSFTIQDVYDIDGQLQNHVEPPFIVRRYLQPHLYLRDSNFALDFQEAATTAASLYQQAGNKTVDGVIGIDYEVLRQIITEVGPLYLPSYDKTIDAENSFSFIHSTIEDTFFPGSSQKRSILQEVFGQITIKLQDPKNALAVSKLFPTLVEEKHILFAFKDPFIQEIFTMQRFAGSTEKLPSNSSNKVSEYFAVNEANIGVNKANTHISRSVSLTQKISQQKIASEAHITFKNTGREEYKVFLRVVVPQGSTFEKLEINGKEEETIPAITNPRIYESSTFKLPAETEIIEENYHDKKTFGFVTTVSGNTNKSVTLFYSHAQKIPLNPFTYNLFYQTQPGTTGYPFTATVQYPTTLIPQEVNMGSATNRQIVVQIPSIKKDHKITAEFLYR